MQLISNDSPPRTNGVTILMGGQILFTQPPTLDDQKFLNQAVHWFKEFQKENPRG